MYRIKRTVNDVDDYWDGVKFGSIEQAKKYQHYVTAAQSAAKVISTGSITVVSLDELVSILLTEIGILRGELLVAISKRQKLERQLKIKLQ